MLARLYKGNAKGANACSSQLKMCLLTLGSGRGKLVEPSRKIALNTMEKRRRNFIDSLKEAFKKENLDKENKVLEKWVIRNYGKRCPDYEKDCACCKAWKCYDYLVME